MKYVSVLVPLLLVQEKLNIVQQVSKILNLPSTSFSLFQFGDNNDCAVNIHDLKISFLQLQQIVRQNNRLQERYERVKQIIEIPQQKSSFNLDNIDLEGLIRKAKKLKQVKEQNKKLRKLLQIQLQNNQKVREQTQKTMNNLREQFDGLVKQMQRSKDGQNSMRLEQQYN